MRNYACKYIRISTCMHNYTCRRYITSSALTIIIVALKPPALYNYIIISALYIIASAVTISPVYNRKRYNYISPI